MGSGSERLGGSDVGKPGCSSYRSVLSFRGTEAEQEKLESAVLIGDCIRAVREGKETVGRRYSTLIESIVAMHQSASAVPATELMQ